MNLSLRKFKPENMPDDKVCVFIGKRGTGKRCLVTDILYHKKHIPSGIVMSATEEGNHHYKSFVPDLFIHSDYDREVIERGMALLVTGECQVYVADYVIERFHL
jgi:hypothetical protein